MLAQSAFLLDGQGLTAVFGRYAQQIEVISYEGAGLADHAPGVYSLMTVASVREFSGMGMYLAFASALLVAFALIHARREPDADTLLLAALLLAAGLPLILPQMNARCLYLAGMLAFACVNDARRLAIAIVLELISLCSYMEAIFSFTVIPMNVLSLLAIACAAALALELMGKLGIKGRRPVKATLDALDERLPPPARAALRSCGENRLHRAGAAGLCGRDDDALALRWDITRRRRS